MDSVLKKCQKEDFKYLSAVLDSHVSFTNDKRRKQLLEQIESNENARQLLEAGIETKPMAQRSCTRALDTSWRLDNLQSSRSCIQKNRTGKSLSRSGLSAR